MNGDSSLQPSFVQAIGEIARRNGLPIASGDMESYFSNSSDALSEAEEKRSKVPRLDVSLVNLMRVLFPMVTNKKLISRHREQAIYCIGSVCARETQPYIKKAVMKKLLSYSNLVRGASIMRCYA